VRAIVLGEVPDANTPTSVAADDLALIRVYDDVVCWAAMVVAALYYSCSGFPNLDCAVLGARDHPLALAVEGDAGNVSCVALKHKKRIWIRRLDIEEFDGVVTGSGEEALVGGNA
jgi:hypothetical protein